MEAVHQSRKGAESKPLTGNLRFTSERKSSAYACSNSPNKEQHLGSRNVEIALEILAKAQIPVASTAVGVDRGQRIVFRTDTGDAVIRVL